MSVTVVPIPGDRLLDAAVLTNVTIPEVNMMKNSSTLAVYVSINISIKLGFVSVVAEG